MNYSGRTIESIQPHRTQHARDRYLVLATWQRTAAVITLIQRVTLDWDDPHPYPGDAPDRMPTWRVAISKSVSEDGSHQIRIEASPA